MDSVDVNVVMSLYVTELVSVNTINAGLTEFNLSTDDNKWNDAENHIQTPAVEFSWPPDRIRKPQSCELTAADSPMSTAVCKWSLHCIMGNVV